MNINSILIIIIISTNILLSDVPRYQKGPKAVSSEYIRKVEPQSFINNNNKFRLYDFI